MIGTQRRELFDRILLYNEARLRRVLEEYLTHYNRAPGPTTAPRAGSVRARPRPGHRSRSISLRTGYVAIPSLAG